MTDQVFEQSTQLRQAGIPYALATIIQVRGSASARPGSKAVISHDGKNLAGWVGGGCAESFICSQALESLTEQKPRIVTADLDDEIFGLGMPCGGVMDVYIEPVLPARRLIWPPASPKSAMAPDGELLKLVRWQADSLGIEVVTSDDRDNCPRGERGPNWAPFPWRPVAGTHYSLHEQALLGLAHSLAMARNRSFGPMAKAKNPERVDLPTRLHSRPLRPRLWITGKGRITEDLARFATQLEWSVTLVSSIAQSELYPHQVRILNEKDAEKELPNASDFVVIASHHKGDPEWIERAFKVGAPYIGLIASRHRVGLIEEDLKARGVTDSQLQTLRAPAGLDMDCHGPTEIALSLIAEMVTLLHG